MASHSASPKNSRFGKTAKPSIAPRSTMLIVPAIPPIASLYELRGYNYNLQPRIRIMTDEIISGADILGALVMGHPYRSWWCGSDLDIEESRRLVPHQNATTMQVAISVVAASMWNLFGEEPGKGQGIGILSSSDLTKSLAIADYDDFILLP